MNIEEAKKVLKKAGYFVDNLWHIQDVTTNYDCTNKEAQKVLRESFDMTTTYDQIWSAISSQAEHMNIKRK